jgi:hypothetical protein
VGFGRHPGVVVDVGETLLGKKIVKRRPPQGGMRWFRLEGTVGFVCAQCGGTKTSRIVVLRDGAVLCNGCYGRRLAQLPKGAPGAEDPASGKDGVAPEPGGTASPGAERAAEPAGPKAGATGSEEDDLALVVVEEPVATPQVVVEADRNVRWDFPVRAEHVLSGTCPVPAEVISRTAQRSVDVTFVHEGVFTRRFAVREQVALDGGQRPLLRGLDWPAAVLPGMLVSARWDGWKKVRLALRGLDKPLVVDGNLVRYSYDPRIMTRDLAAVGLDVDEAEELVLITLRELGYLDARGRALLPEPALVRNAQERGGADRPPRKQIRKAIGRLRLRGILTTDHGSLGRGGVLHCPARPGERPVELLCYVPSLREAEREDLEAAEGHGGHGVSGHRVAGHLMRIGHLRKEASEKARRAYREDFRRAGLVGSGELPPGYTYVREHRRGM